MPRFQHQAGIVPAYLRPLCSHVYGIPAAGEERRRRISRSGQNHPQETFPPGQSGSCSAFFISVFHALFSCLQSRFLLFFCQIEVHLKEGVRGSRNSRACCAATVPREKMAPRQDCLLLFILFIFLFIARKRAFTGMEPAVTSDRSRTQTSLSCPWGGSNTPDTSGNKEYSARDKRRNFRLG